jgi:hypothetical protein
MDDYGHPCQAFRIAFHSDGASCLYPKEKTTGRCQLNCNLIAFNTIRSEMKSRACFTVDYSLLDYKSVLNGVKTALGTQSIEVDTCANKMHTVR